MENVCQKIKVNKSHSSSDVDDEFKSCTKCDPKHPPSKYPANDEVCFKCGRTNYFLRMCGNVSW